MNELFKLTRQHYEKNETEASLLSKVTKSWNLYRMDWSTLRSLLAWTQFHVMGLAATRRACADGGD